MPLTRDETWDLAFDGGGFAHGGLAFASSGALIAAEASGSGLLVLDADGSVVRRIETGVTEAHGLATTSIDGRRVILIADPGFRLRIEGAESVKDGPGTGTVVALDEGTGERVLELDPPPVRSHADLPYRPTSVVSDAAVGGDGHLWVADGYGRSLVHRYSPGGTYQLTLGESGDERTFDCPHAVHLDDRGPEPRLYVSDRNHREVHVFDLDGGYVRSFGVPELTSPSGFARLDDQHLLIAELRSRLVIVDENDSVRWVVGADDRAPERPGWPNRRDAGGDLVPPGPIAPTAFNSPHAIVSDGAGTVFVSEFVLGGRLTRWRWEPQIA